MAYKPTVLSQFGIGNSFADFSKKVCIFIDGMWFDSEEYKNSEFRVFIGGCEPYDFTNRFYSQQAIIDNREKFDLILTINEEVRDKCKNAKLFPFGTRRISKDFIKDKTYFEVSFLCGLKNELEGHVLRHNVYNTLSRVKHMGVKAIYSTFNRDGDYFNDINGKDYIFNTSQYSIVIENSRHRNYFTEKLIDSFMSLTIPIYWGCPNINDYFDGSGIITFNNIDELYTKISMLTPELYYSKLPVIEKNYKQALKFEDFFDRVNNEINLKLSE